jgi:hypothetical protein
MAFEFAIMKCAEHSVQPIALGGGARPVSGYRKVIQLE